MKLSIILTPLAFLLATVALLSLAGTVYADENRSFGAGEQSTANETKYQGAIGILTQVRAPKADQPKVDHDRYGFSLAIHKTKPDGEPFACADCHPESVKRFDPATCVTCHRKTNPDFIQQHIADFGEKCLDCHDGVDRFSKNVFDHNTLKFPLLGKHALTACTACHTGVRDLEGFKLAPTDCAGCHLEDNPHPPSFGTDCAACHNSESWKTEVFDHDLAAFKLTGKHQTVPCADCHINNVFRGTPQTCVGCHAEDDVHLGKYGSDCATCHTTGTWKRGPFIHTFPLDHGGQGIIACATCHPDASAYQVYTCYNCHNPVDMKRLHASARRMRTDSTDCVGCHPAGETAMRRRGDRRVN